MAEVAENPLAKRGPGRPVQKVIKKEEPKIEAKPVEVLDEKVIGDEDEVRLTGKELKALKALLAQPKEAAKTSADEGLVSAFLEALRESKKPYKSDAEKENDKRQTEQMRKTVMDQIRNKETSQAYCQHMAGTNKLSDVPSPANAFTAVIWHHVTNALVWGICTICQREFWPTDTDYRYWRQKRSFNQPSKAGDRDGIDTAKLIAEEHPQPFGHVTGVDPAQIIRQQYMPTL